MAKAQTVRSRARSGQRTVVADDAPVDPALPQKKRARHRLIGAIVLCIGAAVLVPLLLEPEPSRPLSDLSVVIPPKTSTLPSRGAEPRADPRPDAVRRDAKGPESGANDKSTELPKSEMPKSAESRSADAVAIEAAPADSAPQGSVSGDADRSKPAAPAPSSASSTSQPTAPTSASAAPAPAIASDGGKQSASKPGGKYLIQVGAFSSDSAAAAALERIQATGMRGFTEKIKTDRGERIRVRAGPFPTRDAAEQAREKLKATGLEAALIAPS